mmetsp:Transcript_114964/g.330169  ORF Transcript_114964/g.330169 Transcript_114964/m.330169 type:complete len:240 (+) Transcript_114964:274-993(+)
MPQRPRAVGDGPGEDEHEHGQAHRTCQPQRQGQRAAEQRRDRDRNADRYNGEDQSDGERHVHMQSAGQRPHRAAVERQPHARQHQTELHGQHQAPHERETQLCGVPIQDHGGREPAEGHVPHECGEGVVQAHRPLPNQDNREHFPPADAPRRVGLRPPELRPDWQEACGRIVGEHEERHGLHQGHEGGHRGDGLEVGCLMTGCSASASVQHGREERPPRRLRRDDQHREQSATCSNSAD